MESLNKVINKKHIYFTIFGFVVITVIFYFLLARGMYKITDAHSDNFKVVDKDVLLSSCDNSSQVVDLPYRADARFCYLFNFKVQNDNPNIPVYVSFYTGMVRVDIYYQNRVIWSYKPDDKTIKSGASNLQFIKLDEKYVGKDLYINFISNITKNNTYEVSPVYLGYKSDILNYLYSNYTFEICTCIFLLIIAIIFLIVACVLKLIKLPILNFFNISLFCFIVAVYIIVRTHIPFLYTKSYQIIYIVDYTSLFLLPIPLIMIILKEFELANFITWRGYVYHTLNFALIVNAIGQIFLTSTGETEFREMQSFTNVFMISVVSIMIGILFTIKWKDFRNKYYIIASILPVYFIFVLGYLNYFDNYKAANIFYTAVCVFIFLLVNFAMAIEQYRNQSIEIIKNEYFEKMAYLDTLTGLFNRHAFKRDMFDIRHDYKEIGKVLFMMIDINGLKKVNDLHGHLEGDKLIINMATVIKNVCQEYKGCIGYRHGGDEFIIVMKKPKSSDIIAKITSSLTKYAKLLEADSDVKLEFAVGGSIVEVDTKFDTVDIIRDVDKKMYLDKSIKKSVTLD